MTFNDLLKSVNHIVNNYLAERNAVPTIPEQLGLDKRSGYGDWFVIEGEGIVVPLRDIRSANYYGGLEYVDPDDYFDLGNYRFYSIESDRINDCMDIWIDNQD